MLRYLYYNIRSAFWKRYHKWFTKPTPSLFTDEEARFIANKYGLIDEYELARKKGANPDEALQDWDIYPFGEEEKYKQQ